MPTKTCHPSRYPHSTTFGLILVVLSGLLIWQFSARADSPVTPRAVTPRGELAAEEKLTIELFRQASPSVVNITTVAVRKDIFTLNQFEIPSGTGSGFIWDNAGNIVTNFHVIQGADSFQVTLSNHSTWKARLIGKASNKDIAVVRIDAPKNQLRPILVGTSKKLQVGQKVFAIGNPFGLDQTLTTGIISALGREIESKTPPRRPIRGVIQTDAAINPGNSGGPLLDSAGRLIGVNTAIASPSGASAGIGFAIPVDTVNRIVPQLIRHGRVIRPWLGVVAAGDQHARRFAQTGVLILEVAQGSAADKAGIRPMWRDSKGRFRLGDVIVAINSDKVESVNDLFLFLEKYNVGDTVDLVLLRNGSRQHVKVTLQAAPK